MTYAYNSKLSPAVGGGLGGLPRRKAVAEPTGGKWGVNWVKCTTAGLRNWNSACAAKNSAFLAACAVNGYIYTSSDYGSNWTEQIGSGRMEWQEICCSADGTIVYATKRFGATYKSSDSGVSWSVLTGPSTGSTGSIACSDDGQTVAYRVSSTQIAVSTNSGLTFFTRSVAGLSSLSRLCMSRDGLKIFCIDGVSTGSVMVSSDFGVSWTNITPASMSNGHDICCSGDGNIVITASASGVYLSENAGATWECLISTFAANFASCSDQGRTSILPAFNSISSVILTTQNDNRLMRSSSDSLVLPSSIGAANFKKCSCNDYVFLQPVANDYLYISRIGES